MQKLLVLGLLLALAVVVCESGRRYRYSSARSVCKLPPKVGKCGGVCIRYYYDRKKKACRKFKYSCCGGNANNFKSKSLCRRMCKKPRTCPKSPFCKPGICKRQSCHNTPKQPVWQCVRARHFGCTREGMLPENVHTEVKKRIKVWISASTSVCLHFCFLFVPL